MFLFIARLLFPIWLEFFRRAGILSTPTPMWTQFPRTPQSGWRATWRNIKEARWKTLLTGNAGWGTARTRCSGSAKRDHLYFVASHSPASRNRCLAWIHQQITTTKNITVSLEPSQIASLRNFAQHCAGGSLQTAACVPYTFILKTEEQHE